MIILKIINVSHREKNYSNKKRELFVMKRISITKRDYKSLVPLAGERLVIKKGKVTIWFSLLPENSFMIMVRDWSDGEEELEYMIATEKGEGRWRKMIEFLVKEDMAEEPEKEYPGSIERMYGGS